MVFQIYVTDAIKALLEVVTKAFGGEVKIQRFVDVVEYVPKKEETRTSTEIIDSIKGKLSQISGGEQK